MRQRLFLISLALSSASCSPAPDPARVENDPQGAAATATPETESDIVGVQFEDNDKDGDAVREFAYSWPAEISAIPELAAQLQKERDAALAEQKAEWDRSRAEFPSDCISCVNRGYETEWKVVAQIPGWLSLSFDNYLYTGGAHGNYGRGSMVWDREGKVGIDGIDLFNSPVALENALGTALCDKLNQNRESKRGAPVDRSSGDIFNDCPGLDEASVFVGSSNGEYFDRIGIYFGPYVAGSYAEGAYELDFPVTGSVLDAVKPQYAGAFRVQR